MKTEILITGATSATGQYVIQHLLKKGKKVRAMVRVIDDRSKLLEAQGVEIVQGDFFDLKALRAALDGIKRACFYILFKIIYQKLQNFLQRLLKRKE